MGFKVELNHSPPVSSLVSTILPTQQANSTIDSSQKSQNVVLLPNGPHVQDHDTADSWSKSSSTPISKQSYIVSQDSEGKSSSDLSVEPSEPEFPTNNTTIRSSTTGSIQDNSVNSFYASSHDSRLGTYSEPLISQNRLQSTSVIAIEASSLDEVKFARDSLAHFLVNSMLNFQGCDRCPTERQLNRTSADVLDEQNCSDLNNSFVVRPSGSECIRAGVERIPLVLAEDGFLANTYSLDSSDAELIYSGIKSCNLDCHVEKLSWKFKESRFSGKVAPARSFDIDSVMAFPTSIAVANNGLKICLVPARYNNIQSDLHLRIPLPSSSNSQSSSYRNLFPIAAIPHLHLGHLYGNDDYKIFLLFPHLMAENRQNNYLTDMELERFIDHVMLQAIQKNCPSRIIQHLPSSFEMARLGSLARSKEDSSRGSTATSRTQNVYYHLPSNQLATIWETILQLVDQPGLYDFKDPIIFLNAKNLKLGTMFQSPVTTISSFWDTWNAICDVKFLQPSSVWIDLGTEVVHDRRYSDVKPEVREGTSGLEYAPSGIETEEFVFLWRKCCLKSYEETFRNLFPTQKLQCRFYQWALTADIANMTLTPGAKHSARTAGLIYSQFYNTTKEIFDVAKVYPFQNEMLEGLALDPRLVKTWSNISRNAPPDLSTLRNGYLASKKRTIESLYSSSGKSYGVRAEHRISLLLLDTMYGLFTEQEPASEHNVSPDRNPIGNIYPFIVSPAFETNLFLLSNINKYCFGFEYLLSQSINQALSWEQTQLMWIFLRLLRHSYGGMQLERHSELWCDRYGGTETDLAKRGLNIQSILQQRGYGYIRPGLIDWSLWRWRPEIANQIAISSKSLRIHYRHQWNELMEARNYFDLCVRALSQLANHSGNRLLRTTTCVVLSCTMIELFRDEIWKSLLPDIKRSRQSHDPMSSFTSALCISNLKSHCGSDLKDFKFIRNYNRHTFHPFERVTYLWDYDTNRKRNGWNSRIWRILFEMVCERLADLYPRTGIPEQFRQGHFHRFLQHNLVFPQPVNGKFHQRSKCCDGSNKRIWYCAYNLGGQFCSYQEEWITGGGEIGSHNTVVPVKLIYGGESLTHLLQCTYEGKVLEERLKDLPLLRIN